MLFQFPFVSSHFGIIAKKWLDAYDTIESSMGLYFAARTKAFRFLEGRFLSMAQCLETLHRRAPDELYMDPSKFENLKKKLLETCPKPHHEWLKGKLYNEVSFRNRLKKIFEPFKQYIGEKKNTKKSWIRETTLPITRRSLRTRRQKEIVYGNCVSS